MAGNLMRIRRVLLLDTGEEWGGGTVSMIELLKRLCPSEYEVVCCFYNDYPQGRGGKKLSQVLCENGISMVVLPEILLPLWAKILKELIRLLFFWNRGFRKQILRHIDYIWRIRPRVGQLITLAKDLGSDILYMNNQPSSNYEGYIAGELLNIPVVQHARIDVSLSSQEISVANRVAASIICNSHGLKESLVMQGIEVDKINVVYNGIDLSDLPQAAVIPESVQGKIVLGTVGSLVARKCVDDLIKLVDLLVRQGRKDIHLIIVGEGAERIKLEKLIARFQLFNFVTLVGFSNDPLKWIQCMDIFLFASKQEGFGRVLIEAMLCGKPIVAADTVGPNEVIAHDETGFLYNHGDVSDLAKYVNLFLDNEGLRKRFGDAGVRRVKTNFDVESYVNGVKKILDSVSR